jgi:hypothetical protein
VDVTETVTATTERRTKPLPAVVTVFVSRSAEQLARAAPDGSEIHTAALSCLQLIHDARWVAHSGSHVHSRTRLGDAVDFFVVGFEPLAPPPPVSESAHSRSSRASNSI